jgi:hypothetical protein
VKKAVFKAPIKQNDVDLDATLSRLRPVNEILLTLNARLE